MSCYKNQGENVPDSFECNRMSFSMVYMAAEPDDVKQAANKIWFAKELIGLKWAHY